MATPRDPDLYQRTRQLLEPGEIDLDGLVVHTDRESEEDVEMMQDTLAVGELIAEHAGHDPTDTFVYSGNDDPDFSSNQHQGLTLEDESFVWECQQLLRNGTYQLVFYFERGPELAALVDDVADETGHEATPVEGK